MNKRGDTTIGIVSSKNEITEVGRGKEYVWSQYRDEEYTTAISHLMILWIIIED